MRPALVMAIILLFVLASSVFQVEHSVQNLRSELEEINRQLVTDRKTIHVLKAEWSYLNQPERLKLLTRQNLNMSFIKTRQVKAVKSVSYLNNDGSNGAIIKASYND